jgi:octaprenyl-diphosphate synthase
MNPNQVLESAFDRGQKYFSWLDSLHGPIDRPLVETVEKSCGLIWDRKGKRLRCHFVYWFSEPYHIPATTLELYSWAVEAIHTATLLHDDVIDKAEIRRAGPSANKIFDNTIPVLSGDYLMSDAIHQLALNGNPELLKSMCLALKKLSQGEVLQYQNQFKISESEDFYRLLCDLKTASLLTWAASVGPTLAGSEDKLHALNFANAYGLLYQFTDDILDIRGTHTKSIGQDLNEGKLNWAAWKLTQNDPELKRYLSEAFSAQKITPDLSARLADSYNKKSQQKLIQSILLGAKQDCLTSAQLLSSDYLRQLLTTLVEFTLSRVF